MHAAFCAYQPPYSTNRNNKKESNAVDMQLASTFLRSFFVLAREFTRRVDLALEMAGYWTGLDLGWRRDDLACSLFPLPPDSPRWHHTLV